MSEFLVVFFFDYGRGTQTDLLIIVEPAHRVQRVCMTCMSVCVVLPPGRSSIAVFGFCYFDYFAELNYFVDSLFAYALLR